MSAETEGKSLVELLDMLAPAPEPIPISMVPQTWGWTALTAVFLIGVGSIIYLLVRYRRANAYRRLALIELKQAGNDPARAANILRRAALAAFPRNEVASLHGQDWLNFIQHSAEKLQFSDEVGQSLLLAPYREGKEDPKVAKLARDWITLHKVEAEK